MELLITLALIVAACWLAVKAAQVRQAATPTARPVIYPTEGGARVIAYPARRPQDRGRWLCEGCGTEEVGEPGQDVRPAANEHSRTCRALPPQQQEV